MSSSASKLKKEALYGLKEGRSVLRKARKKLTLDELQPLVEVLEKLDDARKGNHVEGMEQSIADLDHLLRNDFAAFVKSPTREWVESLVVAVLIALFLRTFVLEAFKIPSSSMVPTLLVGDYIFVNKLSYGIRIPLANRWVTSWDLPEHGDVIVFVYPNDPDKDYIKRVIGVPGDEIEVRGHTVRVNGQVVNTSDGKSHHLGHDQEDMPGILYDQIWGTHNYQVFYSSPDVVSPLFPIKQYKVEENHLFVMGDNRDNSSDSRVWGQVPMDNVKGKALVVWWSSGPKDGMRLGRIGHLID